MDNVKETKIVAREMLTNLKSIALRFKAAETTRATDELLDQFNDLQERYVQVRIHLALAYGETTI